MMDKQKRMLCGLLKHKRKCQETVDDPTYAELNDDDVRTPRPITPPPVKFPRLALDAEPLSTPSFEGDTLFCHEGLTVLSNSEGYYPVGGFRTKGQLKLAITLEEGVLTVHVQEARHLSSQIGGCCTSFVEIRLLPDASNKSRCITEVKKDCNNPTFDEKFTYETMEADKRKRLMVSMLSKDSGKNCAGEVLGCMSFGIKHLVSKNKKKPVDGWYYLLSKDLGKRKHLQAGGPIPEEKKPSSSSLAKTQSQSKMSQRELPAIPEVNIPALFSGALHTVTVNKDTAGFGFTVRGECPVRIGRVKQGSTAEAAGLQKGDRIMKINGQNVCRSGAESIASIVKKAEKQVILDIQRSSSSYSSLSSADSKYSGPDGESDTPENEENHYSTVTSKQSTVSYVRKQCYYSNEGQWQPALSVITEETIRSQTVHNQTVKSSSRSRMADTSKWDPEISEISRVESMRTFLQQSQSLHGLSMSTVDSESPSLWAPACSLASEDDTRWRFEAACSVDGDSSSSTSSDDLRYNATLGDLTQDESHRQSAIEVIAECEDDFVNFMHCGIQMYSRPLRHLLTSAQHATVFQNVEKLVAISEFLLKGLQESDYANGSTLKDTLTSNLGAIFMTKAKMLCEAYKSYARGLCASFETIEHLRTNREFRHYLKKLGAADIDMSLEDFLKQPVRHLVELLSGLERALFATPIDHPDFECLKDVLEEIGTTCNMLEDDSQLSLEQTAMSSDVSSVSGHSRVSSRSSSSVSSINSQVADLQNRLVFAKHVKPHQVAKPSRHMIFSGDLQHVSESGATTELWVPLLSDSLLFTQKLEGGKLLALEDPISLRDIVAMDFDRAHSDEFTLVVEKLRTSQTLGREARHYTLRAPSVGQKWTWKNLLEQHIQSCKFGSQMSLLNSDIYI